MITLNATIEGAKWLARRDHEVMFVVEDICDPAHVTLGTPPESAALPAVPPPPELWFHTFSDDDTYVDPASAGERVLHGVVTPQGLLHFTAELPEGFRALHAVYPDGWVADMLWPEMAVALAKHYLGSQGGERPRRDTARRRKA